MSATTPRTISNAPDLRQLLVAVGALILAVALLVAVTLSRQASFQASTSVAAPASVSFDHGWSSSAARVATPASGIPYPARPTWNDRLVTPSKGGIVYVGIPYPAPETTIQGGSNGTQRPQ
jgi:hypothetical protein